MKWTQEQYNEYIQKFNAKNNPPRTAANKKPSPCDVTMAKKKTARYHRPVNIHYHGIRKRDVDADGQFTAYFTDAIVSCGILQDDNSKFVEKISQTKEVGKENVTIITITPIEK